MVRVTMVVMIQGRRRFQLSPQHHLAEVEGNAGVQIVQINQIVHEDKTILIIQWFDNKGVLIASSEFGSDPVYICRRWSNVDNTYIDVQRPALIKQYNEKMGGVDLSDRMIAYNRMCARTKKWTVCTILHMLDFCLANSLVQERQEIIVKGKRKKELIEFLDFRFVVSENLLFCGDMSEDEGNDDFIPGNEAPPIKADCPSS